MTEKKKPDFDGQSNYGSFLADVASGRFITIAKAKPMTPEEDAQITKRAAESVFLPREMARLAAELAAIKRANKPGRKCPLWAYVREAKKTHPLRASDHAFIARYVDSLLEKTGKELRNVSPKSWRVRELPRLLAVAREHPKLRERIKVFISKVAVS